MLHLHAHKFEAFLLEPLDDFSNDASLHTIGLDGDEGTLLGHDSETKQKKRDEGKVKCSLQEEQAWRITHAFWLHLAQSAVGPAAEGPEPIAQRAHRRHTTRVTVDLTVFTQTEPL